MHPPSITGPRDPARLREAALRKVLDLISRSRDDEGPVFDAILHMAADLCGAHAAALVMGRAGDRVQRLAGQYGMGPGSIAVYDRGEVSMDPDISLAARATLTGQVVHIPDMIDTDGYRNGVNHYVSAVHDTGVRTNLFVPILTPEGGIGCFIIFRTEVRPYSTDEIALVETFAAQAAIAIENVRQFRELQTRLEREKATAEILEVISQSRDDDRPVFDMVLRKAAQLCGASLADLCVISEDRSHAVVAAHWGEMEQQQIAVGDPIGTMDSEAAIPTCMREGRIVGVDDLADTDLYRSGDPIRVTAVDKEGIRTFLAVPLLNGGRAVGCIAIYRLEVRPFTADQIALVETFAAQAVIAIENVRQFRELQDSLEQQEATSDILRVISQSREDEAQVFDLIVEKAAVLCDADQGSLQIVNEARTHVRMTADWGHDRTEWHPGSEFSLDLPLSLVATIRTAKVVHIEDYSQSDAYRDRDPIAVGLVETEGIRTRLIVPLLHNGIAAGCISLSRRVVRPFTPDEIALVETFAAQAVIAIENVRQFRELQTRLEREKASAEILEIISQSRDDDRPVFDVIVSSAARLCNAPMTWLVICNDAQTLMTVAGYHGLSRRQIKTGDTFFVERTAETITGLDRAILEARTIQEEDLALTTAFLNGDQDARLLVDDEGMRTRVSIPLVSGGKGIGAIILSRREVTPFASDQIALVETFAAQAVIAIENVRQFRELQTRLAREAATREILEVISHSRDDDRPVFDAILRNATRLCGADSAALLLGTPVGPHLTLAALWQWDSISREELDRFIADINRVPMPMDPALHISARAICTAGMVHIPDLSQTDGYLSGEASFRFMVEDQGVRTTLSVPIFDARGPIGCISVHRNAVRPYADDEIALIESFAAQAVIAIENVRQFRELQTRLAREAATREILEVISQSRDDDRPVFDVVLRKAAELCSASMADLNILSEDRTHAVLAADWGDIHSDTLPVGTVWPMDAVGVLQTCLREGRIEHIHDMADTDVYRSGERVRVIAVDEIGIRTILAVPMFSGGKTVACISIYRREVRPFTADEISLVETFAAQAVIAIENVRQFRELQARLEREAATRDILEVISQSRDDDGPVFDVIAQNAARLCGAAVCSFWRVKDGLMHFCASHGLTGEVLAEVQAMPATPLFDNTLTGQVVKTRAVVRIEDATAESYYNHEWARARGLKQFVGVPIFVRDEVWGSVTLMWPPDRAPRDADIALVESFAAQASIAIENVRQFRELQARLEREAATRDILEVISQSRDDNTPVFDMIAQNAARLCRADVCTFWRVEDGLIHYCASHGLDGAGFAETSLAPSIPLLDNTLTGQVVKTRAVARIDDAMAESYYDHEWARARGVKQMIGVPIFAGGEVWGSISLLWRADQAHRDADIQLVESFAAQAAIAIENVRQFKALEALNAELGDRVQSQVGEIERMGRLKRFLPAAVADAVVTSGSEKLLSSHRALLGVLFADIRGFTSFCETAEPEETIEVLQTYHEEMGKLINAHGAGVDHRMGDGIMVLFNDPLPCDDPAGSAVRLAMAMRARMADLCRSWKKMGHRLGFGLGVSLGYATVGMVGSGGRFDYTASGTAINLASRLCDEAQDGEILISPRARTAVEDDFTVESRGDITFKGIREPVEVFCVTGVAAT